MEVKRDPDSARRRRERRLRSMRHYGQLSLKMALACVVHQRSVDAAAQVPECAAPTPVAEDIARAPAVYTTPDPDVHATPAPINECVAPAPATTLLEPPVPVIHLVHVPRVHVVPKTTEIPYSQIIEQSMETPEIRCVQRLSKPP